MVRGLLVARPTSAARSRAVARLRVAARSATVRPGSAGAGVAGSSGAGAAGAGSTGECTVAPIDPSATAEAKKLLCYLYSIYGNHVLSGQQETSWSNPQGDIDYYVQTVNKHPAILGGDYLYTDGAKARQQHQRAGSGLLETRVA